MNILNISTRTRTQTSEHIHTRTRIRAFTHKGTLAHTRAHTHTYKHTYTYTYTRTHTLAHTRTCTQTSSHVHMYVHTRTRTHTHTRTHTLTRSKLHPFVVSMFLFAFFAAGRIHELEWRIKIHTLIPHRTCMNDVSAWSWWTCGVCQLYKSPSSTHETSFLSYCLFLEFFSVKVSMLLMKSVMCFRFSKVHLLTRALRVYYNYAL